MFGINKNLKLHFIGIGGIGMSGIAEVLLNLGYKVSGSDISESDTVVRLKSLGAEIHLGHSEKNVTDVQLIVYSSAINNSNPEFAYGQKNNIPLIKRAEMLAELMRLKFGIAVAGSHGKTTTTSFVATILNELKYDPTHIIGGVVSNLGGNARKGDGEFLVAEADESDGSFLYLNPIMSVVTNIDNDHLDYYQNEDNLLNAFEEFVNKVPFYGMVCLNGHDQKIANLINHIKRPYVTFGLKDEKIATNSLDYIASSVVETELGTSFDVSNKEVKEHFEISLIGKHNVLNALGAIALCHSLGIDLKDISKVISNFKGVARRLEQVYQANDLIVIDDYAHHPTELMATIGTIRNRFQNHKLVVVFEPHRYTRTQNFWKEFVESFDNANQVFILPIYPASEKPIDYIDSEILAKHINERNLNATYINSHSEISEIIKENLDKKSVILTLGAGPISKNVKNIIKNEYTI